MPLPIHSVIHVSIPSYFVFNGSIRGINLYTKLCYVSGK